MNNVKTATLPVFLGALFVGVGFLLGGVNGVRFPYVGRTVPSIM